MTNSAKEIIKKDIKKYEDLVKYGNEEDNLIYEDIVNVLQRKIEIGGTN